MEKEGLGAIADEWNEVSSVFEIKNRAAMQWTNVMEMAQPRTRRLWGNQAPWHIRQIWAPMIRLWDNQPPWHIRQIWAHTAIQCCPFISPTAVKVKVGIYICCIWSIKRTTQAMTREWIVSSAITIKKFRIVCVFSRSDIFPPLHAATHFALSIPKFWVVSYSGHINILVCIYICCAALLRLKKEPNQIKYIGG